MRRRRTTMRRTAATTKTTMTTTTTRTTMRTRTMRTMRTTRTIPGAKARSSKSPLQVQQRTRTRLVRPTDRVVDE